jgi:hypothetical protein
MVKLDFFKPAVGVGVDFQPDRTTFRIDVGDLVDFSVSIGVTLDAPGLVFGGKGKGWIEKNPKKQDRQQAV